jgi:surface antigen
MNFLFLIKLGKTLKAEIYIIAFVLLFLLTLPLMGVFALTHTKTIAQSEAVYNASSYPNDYYAWGNCTWWVSIRRSQTSEPIPNSWGNAATWAYYAAHDGYLVDHTPTYGSIMQTSAVDHGLGHVAFVESVEPNGTWTISEMNVLGLDVVDYKSMPAAAASGFNFIHQPGGY